MQQSGAPGKLEQPLSQPHRLIAVLSFSALASWAAACGGTPGGQAQLTFSYPQTTYVFTSGKTLSGVTPVSSGSLTGVAFSISPALPVGLSLDPSTGEIAGTPAATSPTATYTVTATHTDPTTKATNSATATLTIAVNPVAPSISYPQSSYTFAAGTAITVIAPTSDGGPVASWSIAPALPAGLSFSASNGQIGGTPAAVVAAASYTVTATNATSSATAVLSITVSPAPPVIAYPQSSYVLVSGTAITALVPVSSGGAVATWSVSPALPAGIGLNATTGQITGTPTVVTAAASYTVTATNVTASTSVDLTLTVNPAAPVISYPQASYTFVSGTALSAITPSSTGGAVASWRVSPALPVGIALDATTGRIAGTPTVVTAAASHTVIATNVTASALANLTITVNPAAPAFSYPQSAYVFNPADPIATVSPVGTGGAVVSWSISPALPRGLVFNPSNGQISGTPTALSPVTNYTVAGTNVTKSTSASLSISIVYKVAQIYESGWASPWVEGDWGTFPVNAAAPVPAGHAGASAIEVTIAGSYQAFGWRQPWNNYDPPMLNEAQTIEFDVYFVPGSTAPDSLQVVLNDVGLSDQPYLVNQIPGWSSMTNAQKFGNWLHVTVYPRTLHPTRQDLFSILLFESGGRSGIHFFLQSIHIGYQDRTTPPALTLGAPSLSVDYSQLTLPFTSDEAVLYHVDYGVGAYTNTIQGPFRYPVSYTFGDSPILTGLLPATTVQYRIVATDHRMDPNATPNQSTITGTYIVPPPPTTPPVLSNPTATGITGYSATLGWSTNRPCTAQVTYQRPGGMLLKRSLNTLQSAPSLPLDLLESNQTYAVSLAVTDAFKLSASATTTFTTDATSPASVTITVNPATSHPISPYIYGNNFSLAVSSMLVGGLVYPTTPPNLTLDRWGGNRWTTYNWVNNASNAGSDYLYESDNYLGGPITTPGGSVQGLIAADQAAGMATLMTVPLQGYVSADAAGPVPVPYPNLSRFKPIAFAKGSAFTTSPSTSTPAVYMDEYLSAIRSKFSADIFAANAAIPTFIDLDNEPDLWNSTHLEIQGSSLPSPAVFNQRSTALATALKNVAPKAKLFGPVISGWYGLEVWTQGTSFHLGHWFVDDYLAAMSASSTAYGSRLLDVFDFHWYSQATTAGGQGLSQLTSATLTEDQIQTVVQSPRTLWDHTYTESSWITQYVTTGPIYILDRLQARIDANYPGTPMSISEYDNGAYGHIAGAIAQADNLGIYGSWGGKGLFAATYWSQNGAAPFAMAAFKMYRAYDGNKASFGDTSIAAASSATAKVAAYVSQDTTYVSQDPNHPERYVIVALNRSSAPQSVAFNGLAYSGTAYVYRIDSSADPTNPSPSFVGQVPVSLDGWVIALPAYTVTTIEVR